LDICYPLALGYLDLKMTRRHS